MRNLRVTGVRLRSAPLIAIAILAAARPILSQTRTGQVFLFVTSDRVPVAGAAVASGTSNTTTDRSGQASFTLPTGRRTFRVTSAGFLPESLVVNVVGAGMTRANVTLRRQASVSRAAATPREVPSQYEPAPTQEFAPSREVPPAREVAPPREVAARAVSGVAGRDSRRATVAPVNLEVTDRDAISEQLDRSPGSLSDVLSRVDGVRVQRLSAGSAGAGIRIGGLPARYTKILMDGLPLFGATSEGMELLQTPALGVERVEVVRGVSAARYGPSAVAGVVNIESAPPTSPSEVLANGTTTLGPEIGSDVGIWQTHTFNPKWSASLVAGRHYQSAADPDGDGWAELSGYKRIVVRPRAYWSRSERSTWFMTGGWTSESRRSGTMAGARLPDFNMYREDDNTRRADAGTVGRITLDTSSFLTVRGSMTREWRTRWFGSEEEQNRRNTIFGDVSLTKSFGDNVLVGGVALDRDQFAAPDMRGFAYRSTTMGFYGEHTWSPQSWFGITSGARLDLHSEYGDFVSPRVSVVVHPSETFTARLSTASGVYAPTPLTDETEAFGLSHVRVRSLEAEHATSWSLDLDRLNGSLELRGSAHRTVVAHPLTLRTRGEELELVNGDLPSRTQGVDVSARTRTRPLWFRATYSIIDAKRPEIGVIELPDFSFDTTMMRPLPLNPQHAVRFDLAHQRDNDRIVGVSVNVVGRQPLSDTLYTLSRTYVTMDARLEKNIRGAILSVTAKNVTGVKQSQLIPVLLTASSPAGQWTREPWGPLDGCVINVGMRMKY